MIYIPGTSITIGAEPVISKNPSLLAQNTLKTRVRHSSPFKEGETYTLNHISPIHTDKYIYYFKSSAGDVIEKEFSSQQIADEYIAKLSGKTAELKQIKDRIKNL